METKSLTLGSVTLSQGQTVASFTVLQDDLTEFLNAMLQESDIEIVGGEQVIDNSDPENPKIYYAMIIGYYNNTKYIKKDSHPAFEYLSKKPWFKNAKTIATNVAAFIYYLLDENPKLQYILLSSPDLRKQSELDK